MRNRFIILSLLLFAAQTLPCLALPSDEEAQAPDSIARSEFSLDDFVVTGTRVPKLLKDAPVQTRLITRKDIERSDASNIDDLLQQELPSAEFSYAMNQQVHMNIGGFGGQSVLFLVDGERLAGETMDDVDFSRIPMRDVERIEIVRGASSALYGSNAAGGVVNIITRRARHPWQVTAEARIGKHLNQRYGFGVSASGKRVANTLSASYQSIKNYNVSSDPDPVGRVVSTIYGHRTLNVADRFSYAPVDGLDLSARAGYFFRQIPRSIDSPERYRDYSAGPTVVFIRPVRQVDILQIAASRCARLQQCAEQCARLLCPHIRQWRHPFGRRRLPARLSPQFKIRRSPSLADKC